MTLTRRNAILSAAALTGLPLLLPSQARAQEVGAGATDVNLEEWTLIDSLSDNFDTPLDPSRWHKGLWYPASGVGAFRDENAEASDGVLHLWARAEHHEGRDHTFGAVESVFDTPGVCSYVEVRARALPSAAHVLSAVWLQSSNLDGQNALAADPNPEIDVQETFDLHAMTSATHIWPGNTEADHRSFGGHTYPTADDVSSDHHFYGVERREGEVLIYWDRHLAWRLPAPDPSLWRMSRHVVLSLEGHLGRAHDPALPASFDIDYVHTYYRTPAQVQPDGDVRVLDPQGRALTLGSGGVTLSTSTGEDTHWHLRRQDDLTYVLSSPSGAVLGAASANGYAGGGLVATAAAGTGTDIAGSRYRWHVLSVEGGVRMRSKLSGLALSSGDDQPVTGEEEQATTWRIEALSPQQEELPSFVAVQKDNPRATILRGDWDGDGTVSYAVRLGTRVVFYNENTVLASPAATLSLGRASDTVYVGDWDGDGRDTLALVRGGRVLLQTRLTSAVTTQGSQDDLARARPQG